MSAIRLFLLFNVVLANAEVILRDIGKSTVVVEDDQLHVVVTDYKKCDGNLDIHYDVSEVTDMDYSVAGNDKLCRLHISRAALKATGYNANSKCPLAKSNGNRLNINAVSLPKTCVVSLKNAELPAASSKKAEEDSFHTAVIVGSALGSLILVGLVIFALVLFIGRPWWSRRQEHKRRPVESAVNEPDSLLKTPEAAKTRKRKGKKNKKVDDSKITTATPTPSTSSVAPPPSEAKPNVSIPQRLQQ